MNKLKSLLISVSLVFAFIQVAWATSQMPSDDDGLSTGAALMQLNANVLRTGNTIWDRLNQGFQMSSAGVSNKQILAQERYYVAHPDVFNRSLDRSRKYLYYITTQVELRGMPSEIALLPMVESAFVPNAMSRVGASGLWQFMPETGEHYGLEQTWWYDGRCDIIAATNAALDYLQVLKAQFGDWNLALAAYNWGEGNVARAMARAQAAGLKPVYDNLALPAETRSYVPKLLAIRNLVQDPAQFGLQLEAIPNQPYFVAINTGRHIDIPLAAKLAGISVQEFKDLNPAYNLPVFAYKNGREMLLPVDRLQAFKTNLAQWDKPLLTWQVYLPKRTETVTQVARRTGMSTAQLRVINDIGGRVIRAGQPVLVAMNQTKKKTLADVPRDDRDLFAVNEVKSTYKASKVQAEKSDIIPVEYVVQRGDTLFGIARRFGVSRSDLERLNGGKSLYRLKPGEVVRIQGL